jgi:DNA-directed RNA polymerase specialized sigma24 family protein
MPRPQQALLAERYIDDLDLTRIAYRRGCSVSAVSQRLRTVHRHISVMMPSATAQTAAALTSGE